MQRYNQLVLLCVEAKHSGKPIEPSKLVILRKLKDNLDSDPKEDMKNSIIYKRLEYLFDNGEYI